MKHIITRFCTLMLASVFMLSSTAGAAPMSAEDKAIIERGSVWYTTDPVLCAGGASNVDLTGSENVENAFLYFIARGMSPNQSAGIVGNLVAESGVNPGIQEKEPISGRGGYGIAQWTAERRVAIENFAQEIEDTNGPKKAEYIADSATGRVLESLLFQLDYLYDEELTDEYNTSTYLPIKASTTIRQASDVFLLKFERPLDQSEAVQIKRAALGQKVFDLYGANSDSVVQVSASVNQCSAGADGAVGTFVGFPLDTTREAMTRLNGNCLKAPRMCMGGHPYAAYDIMADTGTPVIAILPGKMRISSAGDKCGGRMISIANVEKNVTVSYLHLSNSQTPPGITNGGEVQAGDLIGYVGTGAEGCGSPHLHIDAVTGQARIGCRRENCPAANQVKFREADAKIRLGEQLYETYNELPSATVGA